MVFLEPCVEVFHLVSELLHIIDDDECISGHLRECEEEIVEVFLLHRIDIHEVKKSVSKYRNGCICIAPDSVDIFYLASLKVLYCEIMHVPCLLEGGD